MQAKDLRSQPPRRWNVRVDGIPWLPRLIDKARAERAGTLGAYLFGQSPMDRSFLRQFRISHSEFARVAARNQSDEAVLSALLARDPESAVRIRRWCDGFERRHGWFLFLLDVDDGYLGGVWRAFKPVVTLGANGLTWTIKRIWPWHSAETSE